jgi:hypothetical protein
MRQQVLRTTGSSVRIRDRKETLREAGRKKAVLIGSGWNLAAKLQGVIIGQFSFNGLNLVYGGMFRPLG